MANESKFFDYEPVTRPRDSKSPAADDLGWSVRQPRASASQGAVSAQEAVSLSDDLIPGKDVTPETSKPEDGQRERILKRGHAVSFAGLFLFTFLVYFRPYELSPSLFWLSNWAFWVALITIAIYIPTQLGLDGYLTIRPREVNMVLLLVVACLLSIPLAVDRLMAWESLTEYLKVVLMFIVLVNTVRTERRLRVLILLVLVASCVLSVSAISDYQAGRFIAREARVGGLIGGLFENPNDLALHLVTMIPIAVGLLFATRGGARKVLYGCFAVLMTAAVIVTFSRAGFLGIIAAGTVMMWRLARHNKALILVLPILVLAFVLLAPGGYSSRLSLTTDDSAIARQDDLKHSLIVAARHPVFGLGMNNYILYSNHGKATHNAYTQVAAELGIPALLAYLLFLITPIKQLRRIGRETMVSKQNARFYYLAVGLEASLVGYMVSSFFASVAYLWYAYYIVGYAICLRRLYAADKPGEPTLLSIDLSTNS
jgi:O-antigen ligase